MPAPQLAERAAHEGRQERAEVDAHVEDAEGAVAPGVAWGVERADLGRDVGFEQAVADDQQGQGREKKRFEGHEEMPHGHDRAADDHATVRPQAAVGQPAAEKRREIDQPAVQAVDVGRGLLGEEQMLGHVEHEQSAHAVKREALPHFGEKKDVKPRRMAQQTASSLHVPPWRCGESASRDRSPPCAGDAPHPFPGKNASKKPVLQGPHPKRSMHCGPVVSPACGRPPAQVSVAMPRHAARAARLPGIRRCPPRSWR